jgi:eukaryotic-like serine/threonine-protein kinase
VWDVATQSRLQHLKYRDRIYGFAASPTDDLVAIRTLERIQLVRLDEGGTIADMPAGAGLPLLAFSPSGKLLAAGTRSAIKFYALDGKEAGGIHLPDTRVTSMAFAPDGSRIAAGCADGSIRVWYIDA